MHVGIIGFGFSGLMVAANLLRAATTPLTLYLIDEQANSVGVAYGTNNPDHLLNVRASNMSAWAQDAGHLVAWLAGDSGKEAAAVLGLRTDYSAQDFIPRALYGAYLRDIWHEAQEIAAHKHCSIKLVPSHAVALQGTENLAILTARGDAIAVDAVVLASGHEARPILPHVKSDHIIQNPWAEHAWQDAAHWASPVMIMGAGLTAVDAWLSLRNHGYRGEVIMTSRRARLPMVHAAPTAIFAFTDAEIAAQKTLRQMLRMLRKNIRDVGDWRVVVDALRPHTQALWQRLTTRDQLRFQRLLLPLWNIHRHRMAPEIAARVEQEIAAHSLKLVACRRMDVTLDDEGQLQVQMLHQNTTHQLQPSHIINCTGLGLDVARSENPLLKQLLADGVIEEHATDVGIVADKHYRAWGALHPRLYVLGSLLTGQLLESTAVPELRVQAASIAEKIRAVSLSTAEG
jgi:uncharacterized NAD(P)/FAD-binding protein YdhS